MIITLCRNTEASCPATPPAIRRLHWPIHDPAGMIGSEDEIMSAFRATRDAIRQKIERFVSGIKDLPRV